MVPAAGARAGNADGIETTESGISNAEARLEDGETLMTPASSSSSMSRHRAWPRGHRARLGHACWEAQHAEQFA